jgi:hypothetical protein
MMRAAAGPAGAFSFERTRGNSILAFNVGIRHRMFLRYALADLVNARPAVGNC